jgi:hypothetical protein
MTIKPLLIVAAATSMALAMGCNTVKPEQTADAIYTGGEIVTVNDAQPTVEAVAVKDGKILDVGTRAEVEKTHKGASTQMIGLGARPCYPASSMPIATLCLPLICRGRQMSPGHRRPGQEHT